MKFHPQTILHSEQTNGNCWVTCLACLLDYDNVPELDIMQADWWEQSEALAEAKGLTLLEFPWQGGRFTKRLCIISGDSPRGAFKHSVIGYINSTKDKAFVDFLHDPHPDGTFITSVDYITLALPK